MKLTTALVAAVLAACAAHALPITHEQAPTVLLARDASELADGTIVQRDSILSSFLPKAKNLPADAADLTDLGLLNAGARSDSKEFLGDGLKRSKSNPWRSLLKKPRFLRKTKSEPLPNQPKVLWRQKAPYKDDPNALHVIEEMDGKQQYVVYYSNGGKVIDPALEDTDYTRHLAKNLNDNALPMIAAH